MTPVEVIVDLIQHCDRLKEHIILRVVGSKYTIKNGQWSAYIEIDTSTDLMTFGENDQHIDHPDEVSKWLQSLMLNFNE
jgi:hypothetical protein